MTLGVCVYIHLYIPVHVHVCSTSYTVDALSLSVSLSLHHTHSPWNIHTEEEITSTSEHLQLCVCDLYSIIIPLTPRLDLLQPGGLDDCVEERQPPKMKINSLTMPAFKMCIIPSICARARALNN